MTDALLRLEAVWTEHQHQVRLIEWCDHEAPAHLRVLTCQIYAVPNGGARHPAVAMKLRAEGVRRGTPDLHLDIPAGAYHGLRIELKTPTGRPKPEQLARLAQLRKYGYRAVIATGWRAAAEVITEYLEAPR